MSWLSWIDEGGRRLVECSCGQAARVDGRGDRITFRCFAGCDPQVTLGSLDLEQLKREVDGGDEQDLPAHRDAQVAGSTLTDFTDIVAKPVVWLWRHRIAFGKITALSGRPKIGKGFWYSLLISAVTRGELDGLDGPRNVILVTTEDEPGDTLKPRLIAAGADPSRVSFFQMGSPDDPVPFRVPQDTDELARRVREKNAALVVIDPLVEFIDGKLDSHKSHPVRQAIASINEVVRSTGSAALVVYHLNKGSSDDPLQRHEGSAAFTQVVRGSLMLGHDPDDPDGEAGHQRVLAVSLSNLAPKATSIVYRIETRLIDGDTGEAIETAKMVEIGESDATARQLLAREEASDQPERDAACAFLEAELASGPVPSRELQQLARDAGISWRTVERAKAKLGIEASRSGSAWEWAISSPPTPASENGAKRGLAELNPALKAGSTAANGQDRQRRDVGGVEADTSDFAPALPRVKCSCHDGGRAEDENGQPMSPPGRCGRCYGRREVIS